VELTITATRLPTLGNRRILFFKRLATAGDIGAPDVRVAAQMHLMKSPRGNAWRCG
jgi:hypothetical protein